VKIKAGDEQYLGKRLRNPNYLAINLELDIIFPGWDRPALSSSTFPLRSAGLTGLRHPQPPRGLITRRVQRVLDGLISR
jgi:hypothetical protein